MARYNGIKMARKYTKILAMIKQRLLPSTRLGGRDGRRSASRVSVEINLLVQNLETRVNSEPPPEPSFLFKMVRLFELNEPQLPSFKSWKMPFICVNRYSKATGTTVLCFSKDGDAMAMMFPMIRRWWTKDLRSGSGGAKWTTDWISIRVSHENTFCDPKTGENAFLRAVMRKNLFLLCYLIAFWDGYHFLKKKNQLCIHKMYDHIWLGIISGKVRATKGYRTEISDKIYLYNFFKVKNVRLALKQPNLISFLKSENLKKKWGGSLFIMANTL